MSGFLGVERVGRLERGVRGRGFFSEAGERAMGVGVGMGKLAMGWNGGV